MIDKHYDYIIVGAGSAGCVIATRIIEGTDATVLLIEAGHKDNNPFIKMPAAIPYAMKNNLWNYHTEPEPFMNNRSLTVPQGKVVGGSSSVNAMVYVRGNHQDYDDWETIYGCNGWGYNDVLPYFKKAENNESLSGKYHGTKGYFWVSDSRLHHPISLAYIKAAQEKGLSYVTDFNGENQEGIGFYQTTTHNGHRASLSYSYLSHVINNPRLTLITDTQVQRIIFEDKKAIGVQFFHKKELVTVNIKHEVIVTSGSIGTAKLLMLSGVGPREHLESLDIDVVIDNQQVGKNLQDHLYLSICAKTPSMPSLMKNLEGFKKIENGIEWLEHKDSVISSTLIESGGFLDLDGDGRVDTQIHTTPAIIPDLSNFSELTDEQTNGITIKIGHVRPASRGEVLLKSKDPDDLPIIKGNYLSHPDDLKGFLRALKFGLSLLEQPSLKEIISERVAPAINQSSDEDLIEYIKNTAETVYHLVGTCRMGSDPSQSALDLKLIPWGIKNLRVADSSVLPHVTSANTNGPVVMIAERAVEFIIKDYLAK